jgi:hypothetical protein
MSGAASLKVAVVTGVELSLVKPVDAVEGHCPAAR